VVTEKENPARGFGGEFTVDGEAQGVGGLHEVINEEVVIKHENPKQPTLIKKRGGRSKRTSPVLDSR